MWGWWRYAAWCGVVIGILFKASAVNALECYPADCVSVSSATLGGVEDRTQSATRPVLVLPDDKQPHIHINCTQGQ